MPTTPLPDQTAHTNNGRRRVSDFIVLEGVRTAFLHADNQGTKRPGRPSLIERTGGTDYQVRRAMRIVKSDIARPQRRATPASPTQHQHGTDLATTTHPPAPPQEGRPEPPADKSPASESPPPEPAREPAPGPGLDTNAHRKPSPHERGRSG